MASTTRWMITAYQHSWVGTTKKLEITTDVAVHMYCRHTSVEPILHKRTAFKRGLAKMEEPDWCFVEYCDIEQEEPGDTLTHTILIPDWYVCQTRWWYFWATESAVPAISNTAIFSQHFEGVVGPPGIGPITIPITDPIIRTGNHYVAWYIDRYFVFIATSDRLTMWAIIDDIPYRLDPDNEPLGAPGAFDDADMRLDLSTGLIHVAAYQLLPGGPPHQIKYYTFNAATGYWAIEQYVCDSETRTSGGRQVCITVNSYHGPTIAYMNRVGWVNRLFGRRRIGGLWGDAVQLISAYPYGLRSPSLWTNPPTDVMHYIAVDTGGKIRYGSWNPPAGPAAPTVIRTGAGALNLHSIMPTGGVPHVAACSRYLKLWHNYGTPPDTIDATLPEYDAEFANMISTQAPPFLWGIVYRGDLNRPTWIYHPTGGPWDPPLVLQVVNAITLSAMLHEDVTFSCLWELAVTHQPQLYARALVL